VRPSSATFEALDIGGVTSAPRSATSNDARRWTAAGVAAALIASLALATAHQSAGVTLFEALMAAVVAASAAYALWRAPPAYVLSLALFASVFSGNWSAMGLPSGLPPDHVLETIGVLLILLRAPGLSERRLLLRPVHWLMAIALAYVLINAVVISGHIASTFQLIDGFGLYPFLFFLVAPVAFQTARDRKVLLITLLCLGAYLGFTALMESFKVHALVFPKYILNPLIGDPATQGRVRGPFAAGVQNGFGLYASALAAAVAVATAKRVWVRVLASAIGLTCLLGTLLTLQRSVWIATVVGTTLILVIVPRLRRWAVPAIMAGAVGVILSLALIPSLSSDVHTRVAASEPVWERLNLDVAAENMIKAKPVWGFGWGNFAATSGPYFRQSASYPLIYTNVVHNVYLSYGAELGIVGLSLWLLVLIVGVGGAMRASPPELHPWRNALIGYAAFYAVVLAFVPTPKAFPPLFLWLLAGLVSGQRLPPLAQVAGRPQAEPRHVGSLRKEPLPASTRVPLPHPRREPLPHPRIWVGARATHRRPQRLHDDHPQSGPKA
jgi:putative inorganic carbon (hco3(-)) transporter